MLKKYIFLLITIITLNSCLNRQEIATEEIKKEIKTNSNDSLQKHADTVTKKVIKVDIKPSKTISGKVTFSNGYCGGIKPSKDMEDEFKKEFPLKNSVVLLKDVKTEKNFRVKTDDNGNFQAELEVGSYNYYMTENYSKTMGASFRSSCDKWLKKCFGQISITNKKLKGYKISFSFGCNPCEPPRP